MVEHFHTIRVGAGLDGVEQLHVADIVDVNLVFQHNDKSLSVEFDGQYRGWERKLTDG